MAYRGLPAAAALAVVMSSSAGLYAQGESFRIARKAAAEPDRAPRVVAFGLEDLGNGSPNPKGGEAGGISGGPDYRLEMHWSSAPNVFGAATFAYNGLTPCTTGNWVDNAEHAARNSLASCGAEPARYADVTNTTIDAARASVTCFHSWDGSTTHLLAPGQYGERLHCVYRFYDANGGTVKLEWLQNIEVDYVYGNQVYYTFTVLGDGFDFTPATVFNGSSRTGFNGLTRITSGNAAVQEIVGNFGLAFVPDCCNSCGGMEQDSLDDLLYALRSNLGSFNARMTVDDGVNPSEDFEAFVNFQNAGLTLNVDATCNNDQLVVEINLSDAPGVIVGGQFFLEYDESVLDFLSAVPGDLPFSEEIFEGVDEPNGEIEYAVGIPLFGTGTSADTTMARITFDILANACTPTADLVTWAPLVPNTSYTKLSDPIGGEVNVDTVDLGAVKLDITAPAITCPNDITVNADAGLCTARVFTGTEIEMFDNEPPLWPNNTSTPGYWYVDRYPPAMFESAAFGGGQRLHHRIDAADSIGSRPGPYQSTFYNTQGRKYDVNLAVGGELAIDLYIPSGWDTDARRADLWATTFDATNAIAGFPIVGFVANDPADELNPNPIPANVVPRFRIFTQDTDNNPGNGYTAGWVNLGLPGGFLYDQWVTLRMELTYTSYEFTVETAQGNLTYTDNITFDAAYFGNLIVQAYSFGSLPTYPLGDSYDVYWDNIELPAASTDNCTEAVVVTVARSDSPSLTLADPFPTGTTVVTYTATDACGNITTCSQYVTVNASNDLVVELQLGGGIMAAGPLDRAITFELWNVGVNPSNPLHTFCEEVEFTAGLSGEVTLSVPCGGPITYTCITARDELHTLRRTASLSILSGDYHANFTGADLLEGGNLNDDPFTDILDFGVLVSQYLTNYGSADTNCSTAYPHADINGDGIVQATDFAFISNNFLHTREVNCNGALSVIGEPRPRISVGELMLGGMFDLIPADLNFDGWLDENDIAAWISGAGPGAAAPAIDVLPGTAEDVPSPARRLRP